MRSYDIYCELIFSAVWYMTVRFSLVLFGHELQDDCRREEGASMSTLALRRWNKFTPHVQINIHQDMTSLYHV